MMTLLSFQLDILEELQPDWLMYAKRDTLDLQETFYLLIGIEPKLIDDDYREYSGNSQIASSYLSKLERRKRPKHLLTLLKDGPFKKDSSLCQIKNIIEWAKSKNIKFPSEFTDAYFNENRQINFNYESWKGRGAWSLEQATLLIGDFCLPNSIMDRGEIAHSYYYDPSLGSSPLDAETALMYLPLDENQKEKFLKIYRQLANFWPSHVSPRVTPREFITKARDGGLLIPEPFSDLLDPIEPTIEEISNTHSTKLKSLRKEQAHREKCRAIATMLWEKTPNRTIEDMIRSDELNKFGCENKVYTEKTMREWIKDLCPNRNPGRRPTKK